MSAHGPSRIVAATALAGALLAGCAGQAPEAPSKPIPLAELLGRQAELQGQVVSVTGRFAGWSGACTGLPPRTRSDWMLVDDTHCVYVTGPVPEGISAPPDRASNGRPLTVRGRVAAADDGRVFLQRP